MTATATTDALLAMGIMPAQPPSSQEAQARRVVTARVLSATADVAVLRASEAVGKGFDAVMPRSEFYRDMHWEKGATYLLEQVGAMPRPVLSAVRDEFIELLLAGVSPEVRSGAVRVVAVAREPGTRAKIAVAATEPGIDPVAACIGRDANRVRFLGRALCGERVDVIAWNPDTETYLRNALAPASVSELRVSGDQATAFVPQHQMPAAVGNGGLNSSLAGRLVGINVTIAPVH